MQELTCQFYRKAITELSDAIVYEITNDDGLIPNAKTRDIISKEIQKINFEHILIFRNPAFSTVQTLSGTIA